MSTIETTDDAAETLRAEEVLSLLDAWETHTERTSSRMGHPQEDLYGVGPDEAWAF